MTLDEPRNWKHAEMLERGEDPSPPAIPEVAAAERIASVVSTHLQPAWLTDRALRDIGMKVVAHRQFVRGVFDELDQDPKRLRERESVRKQQRDATNADASDWFLEQLAYHLHAAEECRVVLRSMPVHRDLYERDEVDADREDARERERRQDEAARDAAPKVAS